MKPLTSKLRWAGGRTIRRLPSFGASLLTLGCLLVLAEREARAYTDPGTGALLWQMLVAGCVGGMFYVRRLFMRFKKKRDK